MAIRSLPWLRLGAEFVVIVVGVLVALAVDQWRTSVDQRALELEYAQRLKVALAADTVRFSDFEEPLAAKLGMLHDLLEARRTPFVVESPEQFMSRLRFSIYVAIPEVRSEVFREMESSGYLGLLTDPSLRDELGAYYALHAFMSGILQDSYGDYREVVTGALPGGLWYAAEVDSTAVDSEGLERGLQTLMNHPQLESAVNTELAYATTMTGYVRQFHDRATALLARLNSAYPE